MGVSFSPFSWWVWGGKEKEPVGNGQSSNSSASEFGNGSREPEFLRFKNVDLPSPSKKVKKKWESRKETIIDWDYDVVMVPSDGGDMPMPNSDDDEADWSIGWMEPHGPNFPSDDNFAVLVPSYSRHCKEVVESSNMELLTAIKNLQNEFPPESKNHMEQWLSSLQNLES